MDTPITIAGNVVNDPDMRTTQSGLVVTSFRIAATPRRFDRVAGEWKEGESVFLTVSCWRHLARNVAASLRKGDGVVVHGRLIQRNWEAKDGTRRSTHEIEASVVGPDLNRGVARPERAARPAPVSAGDGNAPAGAEQPNGETMVTSGAGSDGDAPGSEPVRETEPDAA